MNFSFVVPVKAPAPFLGEALRSITTQTVQDWDVVVALDGWDDEVAAVCRREIAVDRLSLVEVSGGTGISFGLNQAMAVAGGDWIARLDADDVCEPDRLERQMDAASAHPDTVVWGCSKAELFGSGSDQASALHQPSGPDIRRSLLVRNCVFHSAVLMRRDIIIGMGGYNHLCAQMEDYELWLRVGVLHKIGNVDDSLIKYRISPGQVSNRPGTVAGRSTVRNSQRSLARALGYASPVGRATNVVWNVKRTRMVRRRFSGLRHWRRW